MKRNNLKSIFRGVISGFTSPILQILNCSVLLTSCQKDDQEVPITEDIVPKFTIEQTISDEAQRNTIAFDALGFMAGNLGSQTFLPPGKVADYSGFQYLRDNDPTELGHNTSFVTIIAYNIMNILNESQIQMFVNAASDQISLINQYAYKRFPLCKAFRRLIEGDLPAGKTELNLDAVKEFSSALYKIDGEISYNRAQLFGQVINSLSSQQINQLKALKALNGIGNWKGSFTNPLEGKQLQKDVNVAVMTYASEIYAWYAGSIAADVYFCPERQGTYFGSFYLKDWPAMGNSNYTINEQLTATAGQSFVKILTTDQSNLIEGIVNAQKVPLLALVDVREEISTELRNFQKSVTASESTVLSHSEEYGRYDGEIIYLYATRFSQVYKSLSPAQKTQLLALANSLGYINPSGAFLYSDPIAMPEIENTDYFFK
jgi:hypothetical protein